jgi:hypothetical protein
MLLEALIGVNNGQMGAGGADRLRLTLGLESLDLVHHARDVAKKGLDSDLARVVPSGPRKDGGELTHDLPPSFLADGEWTIRKKARKGQERASLGLREKGRRHGRVEARPPCHTGGA